MTFDKIKRALLIPCLPFLVWAGFYLHAPMFFVLALGGLLNSIALFANGGRMPVKESNKEYTETSIHQLLQPHHRFKCLCDVIPLHFEFHWEHKSIASVGDVLVFISIVGNIAWILYRILT